MSTTSAELNIPVISVSSNNLEASSQLLDAAARYGFVFVENDEAGIPPDDISRFFELSRKFFTSPIEVKEQVSISSNKAGKNHGWLGRGIEKLDPATQKRPDVKEAFNVGEHHNGALQQPLPITLEQDLDTITDFQDKCHKLCLKILEQLAIALGIERNWFIARHDRARGPSGTVLRMLYYPQVPDIEDGVDIRAGAHSDYGSITLLFQLPGQPGLQIQTPTGQWAQVPVDPHDTYPNGNAHLGRALPILVNIGDLLEDWTGGLLKSTVHRVIFPAGDCADRYSIAYFCHPLDDAELVPVPSKLVQDHAAKTRKGSLRNGEVLTAKDHLMERLAATYTVPKV